MTLSKNTKDILIIAGVIGGAYLIVQAGKGVEQGVTDATDNVATVGGIALIGGVALLLLL